MRVVVVGAGYVGATTAVCLAWLGHRVVGLDIDDRRARQLAEGQLPFYEPELPELSAEARAAGRLAFTSDARAAIGNAEMAFICVGTPPGAQGLPDLSQVREAATTLARHLPDGLVIVNKSTVPVGSANLVRTLIEEAAPARRHAFSVMSNPEFLREGQAVQDFLHPDRLVLGGEPPSVDPVLGLYRPILDQGFPGGRPERRPRLFLTDLTSAEMVKYAANAFLATKISFANEIANLCELLGADARTVLPAIGADRRIGPDFLRAGLGYGGSCLPKDLAALAAMGSRYGYHPRILEATRAVNDGQRAQAVTKLQRELKALTGRRIALLGLAFKPHTDDLRDAPALDLARRLAEAGAHLCGYDPAIKDGGPDWPLRLATDPYEAAARADAVVVATEWPEFARLDLGALAARMDGDLILDLRNVLDQRAVEAAGLRLVGVGW